MLRRLDWMPLHRVIVRGIEKRQIVDDDADCDDFVQRLGELGADLI